MIRNISPQDVSWFLDLHQRGRLDLSPPYQRRSVWTPRERRFFLDTIFNGYPCPPVFLYKSISDEGIATYHVVDGKQRLETIINFVQGKVALSNEVPDERLAGRKWKQIEVELRKRFWNYQFAVEMLDTVDPAIVKEIFDRYNRTSKNLERQELRHAKFDGWFVTFAEKEAQKQEWRRLSVVTTGTARRMKDVQFISELMVVLLENGISGFDQDMLDDYYAKYDTPSEVPTFSEEEFSVRFENVKQCLLEVENSNGAVTKHAKSNTNFYSLWSVLALNLEQLPPSAELAAAYDQFMIKVEEVLKTEEIEDLLAGDDPEYKLAHTYAINARGASTEFPQRNIRHDILRSKLLGIALVEHEDHEDGETAV